MILLFHQSGDKFLDDFPGHGEMEGPDLLSSGDDLFRREEEAVSAGVSELHPIAVGDTQLSQSPVQRAPTGNIEHAGNTANLVRLLMNSIESIISSFSNPKSLE